HAAAGADSRHRHRDPVAVVQRRGGRNPRRVGQAGHRRFRRGPGLMATSVTPRFTRAVAPPAETPLLRVDGLTVEARRPDGSGRLVEGISFGLARGPTLRLVGGSGSGKTGTPVAVIPFLPPPPRLAARHAEVAGRAAAR